LQTAGEQCERRPGDPARLIADSSRIQAELGWRPRFDDLEVIVRSALDWEEALARRQLQPA